MRVNEFRLNTIPGPLRWINHPLSWQLAPDGALAIEAGPRTDWFADPAAGGSPPAIKDDAPAALFTTADEEFILSARVSVAFASSFDAGSLQLRASAAHWGKLCFEYSPQGRPMIVSVVTRGRSDDCNSTIIALNQVYLRVARLGQAFSFHYSEDGQSWPLVRYFTLGPVETLQAGFSAQSPTGRGCRAVFSEVTYAARRLEDIRSGE
jgi:regulation of enolase protein 1 (concanavalin A-like superfamily)